MSSRATAILILTGLVLVGLAPSAAAEPGKDPNDRSSQAPGQEKDREHGHEQRSDRDHGRRENHGNNTVQQAPVAPELTVHEDPGGGNHLVWTEPEILNVTAYRIYSVPPGGDLELVATVDQSHLEYLDATRLASAWYVVVPVMQDGMGPSSNPASASSCSWLTIGVPPILRPECLRTLDLPLSNTLNSIEPSTPTDFHATYEDG